MINVLSVHSSGYLPSKKGEGEEEVSGYATFRKEESQNFQGNSK